jgi:phosphatidate cytidylyltransferase
MDKSVLQTRSITGLIFGTVVIGSILSGTLGTVLLLLLIGAGCTWEYLRMVRYQRIQIRWTGLVVFFVISSIAIFYQPENHWIKGLVSFHFIMIVNAVRHLWKPHIEHEKVYWIHVLLYTVLPVIIALYCVIWMAESTRFLLYILLMIWMSDSAAYFTGSLWGKHKLFEKISPKKTWEGFLGAGICTILTGILLWKLTNDLNLARWIIMAVWIWVAGTFGDLYESSIKRHFGVKDSGHFLPGHGGFLDRFDSFLFVISVSAGIFFLY